MATNSSIQASMTDMKNTTGMARPGKLFTLSDSKTGIQVVLMEWGAGVQSVLWPDKSGIVNDVVLGFDTAEEYSKNPWWFGTTIGRVAGRISNGAFTLDEHRYEVTKNNGPNSCHGGDIGLARVLWHGELKECGGASASVKFTHTSPEGTDGYPGNLECSLTYTLSHEEPNVSRLALAYSARTDKACPVAMANHGCWNLAGVETGETVHSLRVTIDADREEETTPPGFGMYSVPTGRAQEVAPLSDFRKPTLLGDRIPQFTEGGYNHILLLNPPHTLDRPRIVVRHEASGREMQLLSDQQCLQFYTGQYLQEGTLGKGGHKYGRHSYICVCDSHCVDAVNHSSFPSCILRPGEQYSMNTVFRFLTH